MRGAPTQLVSLRAVNGLANGFDTVRLAMTEQNKNSQDDGLPLNTLPPLSLHEFARQSGISPTTLWRYRKRGWRKTVLIANKVYVSRQASAETRARSVQQASPGPIEERRAR